MSQKLLDKLGNTLDDLTLACKSTYMQVYDSNEFSVQAPKGSQCILRVRNEGMYLAQLSHDHAAMAALTILQHGSIERTPSDAERLIRSAFQFSKSIMFLASSLVREFAQATVKSADLLITREGDVYVSPSGLIWLPGLENPASTFATEVVRILKGVSKIQVELPTEEIPRRNSDFFIIPTDPRVLQVHALQSKINEQLEKDELRDKSLVSFSEKADEALSFVLSIMFLETPGIPLNADFETLRIQNGYIRGFFKA